MLSMPELLTTVRRHRQAIFALVMIVTVVLILWLARGAMPTPSSSAWRWPSSSTRWCRGWRAPEPLAGPAS